MLSVHYLETCHNFVVSVIACSYKLGVRVIFMALLQQCRQLRVLEGGGAQVPVDLCLPQPQQPQPQQAYSEL